MKVFISVVSHNHEDLIEKIGCLQNLSECEDFEIIVKLNTMGADSRLEYLKGKSNVHIVNQDFNLGFGENNNYIANWCSEHLGMQESDWFLILNPDVYIDEAALIETIEYSVKNEFRFVTVNLFKDDEKTVYDPCVREFPKLTHFISSFCGLGNKTIIDKNKIDEPVDVDWAAGSFLLFRANVFRQVGGFDEKYFMYCEDIDICWRVKNILNVNLVYLPNIKATHYAQHANRSMFSKHFMWHLQSCARYLTMIYGIRSPKKQHLTKTHS